uniref:DNA polymerase alpha subunit B n=1 Tax=Piliocolobus tephrosceles TaxID=591936 RepID=A0A8C9GEY7_9PRIM
MKEIKHADVKYFLDTYYTGNKLSAELKEVFDFYERNSHKNNFFKLFEEYLEEYNKRLIKDENMLKDIVVYNYEYVKLYNNELIVKPGVECNNKCEFYVNCINTIDNYYKFLGLDSTIISDCINNKITFFSELYTMYIKKLNLNIQLNPILNMDEEESYIFGRIYTDNDIKISETNIILEGNLDLNNGNKTQLLNINNMKRICFFLGQILTIKGKKEINQFSTKYYVSDIHAGLPTFLNEKLDIDFLLKHFNCKEIEEDNKIEKVYNQNHILQLYNNDNIHIMICNGYTHIDNEYKDNLDTFLKIVNEKLPHVVIILGPFLYIRSNETIQKIGDINVIYEYIFNKIIKVAKKESLEKTHFYIIPSLYDPINIYPLPQPPFFYEQNDDNTILKNIHFLSNPSYIYINEIKIAITSCDIIYALTSNLLCRPSELKLFFLCEQIIKQLSLFPAYPSEYNIEITKFKNLLFQPNKIPDIFIFPSFTNQKSYVQEVHKKLFICPYSIDIKKAQPCNFFSNIYILPPTDSQELVKRVVLENIVVSDNKETD